MNSLVQHLRGPWPPVARPALPPQARQALDFVRKQMTRHRRAVAVIGSLLLHLMVILALLPHAPEGLSTGGAGGTASGGGTGETYASIDLYPPAPSTTAVKTPETKATDALDTPAQTAQPASDTIAPVAADLPQLNAPDVSAPSPPAAIGGAGQAGTTSGAGDDLWAAIAPCWNRIAGKDTLSVALKVTFAGNGGLAKPPVIERADSAAITPQSLQSEARAITALAQCGAYPMAAGREDVTVNFPKPQ